MGKRKTETMHGHPNKDSLCYCLIVGVGSHNPAFQVRKQARRRTRPRTSRGPQSTCKRPRRTTGETVAPPTQKRAAGLSSDGYSRADRTVFESVHSEKHRLTSDVGQKHRSRGEILADTLFMVFTLHVCEALSNINYRFLITFCL